MCRRFFLSCLKGMRHHVTHEKWQYHIHSIRQTNLTICHLHDILKTSNVYRLQHQALFPLGIKSTRIYPKTRQHMNLTTIYVDEKPFSSDKKTASGTPRHSLYHGERPYITPQAQRFSNARYCWTLHNLLTASHLHPCFKSPLFYFFSLLAPMRHQHKASSKTSM